MRRARAYATQAPFPSLALGDRLVATGRPATSALLSMHHPIGASTGYLPAREDWAALVRRACAVSTFAIELSALSEGELPGLVAFLHERPRLPFHYLSVHAPTKQRTLPDARLVQELGALPPHVDAIVMHPDQVSEPAAWRPLGRRLVLENMDGR